MPGPVVYRPPSLADLMRPMTGPSPAPAPAQPPVQLPSEPNRPIGKDPLLDIGEAVFGALGIYDPLDLKASSATQIGGMVGAAGLPLIGMAANALKGTRLAKAGQVVRDAAEAEGILAYHGSPHDFDKFSTSAIGTGEGAQVYGRGLYFAQKKGVAQSYRDSLSNNASFDLDRDVQLFGKPPSHFSVAFNDLVDDSPANLAKIHKSLTSYDQAHAIDSALFDLEADVDAMVSNHGGFKPGDDISGYAYNHYENLDLPIIERRIGELRAEGNQEMVDHFVERRNQIKSLMALIDSGDLKIKAPGNSQPGKMYKVRIKTTPDKLLDWDKPILDQPDIIAKISPDGAKALQKYADAKKELNDLHDTMVKAQDAGLPPDQRMGIYADLVAAKRKVDGADINVRGALGVNPDATGGQFYKAQIDKRARDAVKVTRLDDGTYEVHDTVNNRKTIERNDVLADSVRRMWAREDPFSHEAAAVDLMKTSGIPGIKYLDGMSRGRGKGTHNFVVFDDNIIDVLKKWGLMLPIGGATLGSLMSPQGGSQ